MECASGNGVCIWEWSVHLGMECASGNGVCVWEWSWHLGMECASGNGVCVWEWSVRLGIGCVWEVDLITAELLLGGCSREERAEVAVIQPPPGEEG